NRLMSGWGWLLTRWRFGGECEALAAGGDRGVPAWATEGGPDAGPRPRGGGAPLRPPPPARPPHAPPRATSSDAGPRRGRRRLGLDMEPEDELTEERKRIRLTYV